MTTIKERCSSAGINQQYINNWFSAASFFNTFYTSELINQDYFITGDNWMSSKIFAVRQITPTGIETIAGPLDSIKDAENFLNEA